MTTKNFIAKFFNSVYYIIFLTIIAFLCWYFNNYIISAIIFAVIIILILIFSKDTTPMIPPIMLSPYLFSENAIDIDITLLVLIFAPIITGAFIFYIIKNKPSFKNGKFLFGLLLAVPALSIGGLLFDKNIINNIIVFLSSSLIVFLYTFFSGTVSVNYKKTLLNSITAIVILLLLQIFSYYFRVEDINYAIINKHIHLGWGNSNNVGLVLSMLLPLTFYKSLSNRFFVLLAFLQYTGILFSLSRGNILFSGIFFVILLVFCIITNKDKILYLIMITLSFAIILFLVIFFKQYFTSVYNELSSLLLDDNGRFALFAESIESFKLNPLFGTGFYYKYDIIPYWYHNTLLQILASMGIIGSLLFIPFFYQRYVVILKNFNKSNFFMLCSILLSALYGLVDCNFFFIYNAFLTIFIYLVIEKETDTKDIFKKLKKL